MAAHLEAVNAANRDMLAESTSFPLFQGGGGGEKSWYTSVEDVPFPLGSRRMEIVSEDTWASTNDVVLFSLVGEVIDPDGAPPQRVHMLWSAHRIGEEWKIGWRQFLGPA